MKTFLPFAGLLLMSSLNGLHASPLEDKVLALFQSKCAGCHQGDEEPELSKDTSLSALSANSKFVTPGDSNASRLIKVLLLPEMDKEHMPKSTKKKPLPPLSTEELAVVRQWINGDASEAASAPRTFISPVAVDDLILADLKKLKQTLGGWSDQIRYLSLVNIYNERNAVGQPLHGDEQLEYYRTAVNKLLNSLSWKPEITTATAIDPARVIFRVDLGAYGIATDLWHRMAGAYPYRVERDTPSGKEAQKLLGDLHVMRADYFAFISAQPPYYHILLGLPGVNLKRCADVELETRLGVAYHRDVKSTDTVRAGFQKSGVSQGNRLIERIQRPNGDYYWKSYDFNTARQNDRGGDLFRHPLGPINAGLTQDQGLVFSPDGGEIIFSLPNGLQAYMLIDALGVRLDEAPVRVVTDKSRKDSRIINGISCMQCHKDGMFSNGVVDQMLASTKNLKLAPRDHATMTRMHDQKKLERYFAQDSGRFMAAVVKCGPAGKEEPVSLLYFHYLNDLSPSQLHAELELDPSADLLAVLSRIQEPEVVNLTAKYKSATPLPRQDFEKVYPTLVASLGIGKVPPRESIAVIEFGGDHGDGSISISESSSGPTVIGNAPTRTVIQIGVTGAGVQPGVGAAVISKPETGGQSTLPSVIRINGNGAPITTTAMPSAPPVVPPAPPSESPPPPGTAVKRRFDANGVMLPKDPLPAPTPDQATPPCPTNPSTPIAPSPAPTLTPTPKPRKIGGDGKPVP